MASIAGKRTNTTADAQMVQEPKVVLTRRLIGPQDFKASKNAEFLETRMRKFRVLQEKQAATLKERVGKSIEVHLPDGKLVPGTAFETTPYDIALSIAKGLANNSIVANVCYFDSESEQVVDADDEEGVDGCCHDEHTEPSAETWKLWDINRPLENDCKLQLLKFDTPEAQHVFWHSSAHILGQALENEYGAQLTIGPALDRGFYYDFYMGNHSISLDSYSKIQNNVDRIVKEQQQFHRVVVTKEEALDLFDDNPFKQELIKAKLPDGTSTTVYGCGTLVDLCRGPHVSHSGIVKCFSVEKHSSAYWLGDSNNDSLQRVYGISFPDNKLLKEYRKMLEEAKKRDHRLLGNTLNLYFFDNILSPGSTFWLSDGAKVYNKFIEFIRKEYRIRGFNEVITPNIYSEEMFKISGHAQNYQTNMYMFDVEGARWGLKPMNCPGHCVLFKHMNPSYRGLPIRMAEFGVLHRNELSGSLSGLTRVRRFMQDDAHIFARIDQVKDEVADALDFLLFIYKVLGFQMDLKLSTRPKKALGDVSLWKVAEESLASALDESGLPWTYNKGDGAFYGPKIDVRLQDAIQRWHQCGTIQLDFQLPLRFNLSYRSDELVTKDDSAPETSKELDCDANTGTAVALSNPLEASKEALLAATSLEQPLKKGYERPVMIHRAILGSVERMCAVFVEHSMGKFPFWLSPRQAILCPVSEHFQHYARWVSETIVNHGYDSTVDESNRTINKKIREAQLQQYNFILVVGEKEEGNMTVTVRERDNPNQQYTSTVEALLQKFKELESISSQPLNAWKPYIPPATTATAAGVCDAVPAVAADGQAPADATTVA
eukprot:Lankesteria_metandrocarpae@DN4541_c0_g1_i1.p1